MILKVEGLRKYYGRRAEVKAVDDVSFEVREGEIVALLGPNGAGKTTIVKCILGLRRPSGGSVRLYGSPVSYVPEGKELYEGYSVESTIRFTSLLTMNFDEVLCNQLIEEFAIPKRERVSNLSNGERTLLYLAIALAQKAMLYVFDEPTWGLDPIMRNRVLDKVRSLTVERENAAVIYTSNILGEVEKVADRVSILSKGRILEFDNLDNLKEKFCTVSLRRGSTVPGLKLWLYKRTEDEDVYVALASEAERARVEYGPASLEVVFETLVLNSRLDAKVQDTGVNES